MKKLFISHSSKDDSFVSELRAALADHGHDGWIDSRELRGGDPLWPEIQKAIEAASAYAVVVSTNALQSKWVGKELQHALALRDKRGKDEFPVIPLSLDGTKLGVLEEFFGEEPVYIPVSSEAGGVEAAMDALLVALGERLPADVAPTVQPKAASLEELVLELTDLRFHEQDSVRRASARARLVYEPADPSKREVATAQSWRFVAPIGPIEAEELRWYLEEYAASPRETEPNRARNIEEGLAKWGQLLYKAAIPTAYTANVMSAWAKVGENAGRRFSILVDTANEAGASETDVATAKEVASLLLYLPWELLHDGDSYLMQGAKPMCVRRRLPNTRVLDTAALTTPIRILLVTARPEDDICSYVDHRASALPLVEAMEQLGGLVRIRTLSPPTLPALRDELARAVSEKKPYHVIHFDGHGLYDQRVGLGALCFEHPRDVDRLESRRHVPITTSELRPLLRDYRIPLVFLGAFSSVALNTRVSECIATELLELGSVSVAVMSHKVLVETLRRFVHSFYTDLANGLRVGEGILRSQCRLKDDPFRGRIFGMGDLQLEDWFVPVLYQEKDDPQLFKTTPVRQTKEDLKIALSARLGDLPPGPKTGFIGRSRELLTLQRILREERYAVVRGQGGEGKTALATEFARWMVRSQQFRRAAFVSVETHGNERAIVDALGKQLTGKSLSVVAELDDAIRQVERALREQPTLLVIDNMESVLLPPFMETVTPAALSVEAAEELKAILTLCQRLLSAGDTRIIFTSREMLPKPFDAERYRRDLQKFHRDDAVKLVESVVSGKDGNAGASSNATRAEIERLVDTVQCHARTLALLAPSLREHGVEATRESLAELMAEMESNFPGSREKSLFSSVELSLRRMSPDNQQRARVLGVFHGAVDLHVLKVMMQWEELQVRSLASELIEMGLATSNLPDHLSLNPALCPYLRARMTSEERETLTARWVEVMRSYSEYLGKQKDLNAETTANLTTSELPNLFALLDLVQNEGNAEATIDLATSLFSLLQPTRKPRLLEQVGRVRDAATATLDNAWSHARFDAARTIVEQRLAEQLFQEAIEGAQKLHQHATKEGAQAYPGADYDLAMACRLFGRVLKTVGYAEPALQLLNEALQRFEAIAAERPNEGAEQMVVACFQEQGDCLLSMGRLEEAAAAYQEFIDRCEQRRDLRGVALGKNRMGTVHRLRGNYEGALTAFEEARQQFTQSNFPEYVAVSWHQTGMVHQEAGDLGAAEDAYRRSLAIEVQLGDVAGQATTLDQLGTLYRELGRLEEAAAFYQQAVDKSLESGDLLQEGLRRRNRATTLRQLKRFDEARQEILRAIECNKHVGHAAEPWTAWAVLQVIETDTGNIAAAAEANRKAVDSYLAYRRDGGENHDAEGRISFALTQSVLSTDAAGAVAFLEQLTSDPDLPSQASTYIRALQAIVAGSRDRSLADAPDLDYGMATEILLLIETLEKRDQAGDSTGVDDD